MGKEITPTAADLKELSDRDELIMGTGLIFVPNTTLMQQFLTLARLRPIQVPLTPPSPDKKSNPS